MSVQSKSIGSMVGGVVVYSPPPCGSRVVKGSMGDTAASERLSWNRLSRMLSSKSIADAAEDVSEKAVWIMLGG